MSQNRYDVIFIRAIWWSYAICGVFALGVLVVMLFSQPKPPTPYEEGCPIPDTINVFVIHDNGVEEFYQRQLGIGDPTVLHPGYKYVLNVKTTPPSITVVLRCVSAKQMFFNVYIDKTEIDER